MKDRI